MPKGLTKINSPESFNQWTKQKPVLDRECILLTANFDFSGFREPEKEINCFEIKKVADISKDSEHFYYGIHELDGEEWGDYDELEAEYYCILDYPNQSERSET